VPEFCTPISAAKSINRPNPANEILLNKPIKEYSPVYEDDDIAETETSAFSLAGVLQSVKSILMDDKINQIITFGLMGIVFLFGVKLIRRKDNDISVGLSQSLRDREINYYKDVQAKAPSITPVMEKPYSSAYGVNAYRNMSRNPYDTETKHTPVSTPINPVRRQTSIPSTINPRTTSAVRVPNMTNQQAKVAVKQPTITQPAKGDNIKFLEAMSAIYEKSGRYDLAQGIKTSIKKANK